MNPESMRWVHDWTKPIARIDRGDLVFFDWGPDADLAEAERDAVTRELEAMSRGLLDEVARTFTDTGHLVLNIDPIDFAAEQPDLIRINALPLRITSRPRRSTCSVNLEPQAFTVEAFAHAEAPCG